MSRISRRGKWGRRTPRVLRGVAVVAFASAGLCACASAPPARLMSGPGVRAYNRPYQVHGRWYTPQDQPGYDEVGIASWYSYESPNRTTSDGERFDARLVTAAHKTLPIPSYLDVTNLDNGRTIRVRLNDRGPFAQGRIIDLSRAAAAQLGYIGRGTARVRVRYVGPAPLHPDLRFAEARASDPDAPPEPR